MEVNNIEIEQTIQKIQGNQKFVLWKGNTIDKPLSE